MKKKNRPNKSYKKAAAPAPATPVLHGNVFRTFLAEATSIGNEVQARREFDADVVEFLTQKGLSAEWDAWRTAKHAPKN